jgi:Rps23 Pro-64 3,4-dihydroxylase Tpa1-like proline 4-hydroxylase
MIYYLNNDGWQPGDGGETALFATGKLGVGPFGLCPPVNNSLLLFECTPHSFHSLIANPRRARDSVILWLHSTVEDAEAKWGTAINRRRA